MEAEKITFATEEEWLKFRKGGIGGSNAPNILGVGYNSPLTEWAYFRGLTEPEPPTEQMKWGTRFQLEITKGYMEETGRIVEHQGIHTFVNKKYDFIRYSTDGLILDPWPISTANKLHTQELQWIFEAKNTGHYTVREIEEELPLNMQVQIQHGLFTLGLQSASIAILIRGNQLRWKDIERNESFIEQMLEKELAFWKMVLTGTPPGADYLESTAHTIAKLYPKDSGSTVQLPVEAVTWADDRRYATEQIKKYEKVKDEAENKLKMAIGDNTFGALTNGGSFSWKWQERKAYEVKATEFRALRRKGN